MIVKKQNMNSQKYMDILSDLWCEGKITKESRDKLALVPCHERDRVLIGLCAATLYKSIKVANASALATEYK